jgi:hypothetical protein
VFFKCGSGFFSSLFENISESGGTYTDIPLSHLNGKNFKILKNAVYGHFGYSLSLQEVSGLLKLANKVFLEFGHGIFFLMILRTSTFLIGFFFFLFPSQI